MAQITDAFTGTNGTGIVAYSPQWAYMSGATTDFQIQSNSVCMASSINLEGGVRRNETGFPNDQFAQGTVAGVGDSILTTGVAARCQAAGSGSYYAFYTNASSLSQLFKYNGTTWTQFGTNSGAAVAGDVIKLDVTGTTITPNKNGSTTGTPGAFTDATYSSGAPGIAGFNNGGRIGTNVRLDDFVSTYPDFGGCIQSAQNSTNLSASNILVKAFAVNVTKDNMLAIAVYSAGTVVTFTVSDNMGVGNSWAQDSYEDQNSDLHAVAVWKAIAKASGACQITVQTSFGSTIDFQMGIAEYAGPFATTPLDTAESNQGLGTAVTSGPTPGVLRQRELCVAAVGGSGSGTTCTGTNGFTVRQLGLTGATNFRMAMLDKIETVSGAETATATLGSSQNWSIALATYKASVQFGRPASDTNVQSWTTAPLFSKINENPPSDVQLITSDTVAFSSSSTTCEVKLGPLTDPLTGTGHFVRARASVGFADGSDLTFVALYQGATLISSHGYSNAVDSALNDFSFALTAAEANTITDYTDLRLQFQYQSSFADATGNLGTVSWAELEVPAASAVGAPAYSMSLLGVGG